jgi:hypothetical protein
MMCWGVRWAASGSTSLIVDMVLTVSDAVSGACSTVLLFVVVCSALGSEFGAHSLLCAIELML